jgi:dipeptidyl aminopeptidase/acylaminoacyl peptidase
MKPAALSAALPPAASFLLITCFDAGAVLGPQFVIAQELNQGRPTGARAGEGTPFPLDLAFSYRQLATFDKPAISPSGSHLAYSVRTPSKAPADLWTLQSGLLVELIGTKLHVAEVVTGKSNEIGAPGSTTFSPAWSPDGKMLAYYSDEGGLIRVWILEVSSGRSTPAANVRLKVQAYTGPVVMPPTWSPDSRKLLVPALPEDERHADPRPAKGRDTAPQGATKPRVTVFTSGAESVSQVVHEPERPFASDATCDLTEVNIETGAVRIVLPSKRPGRTAPAFARYSPSGRHVAYLSAIRLRRTPAEDNVLDLGVIELDHQVPLYEAQLARMYDGYESHSGSLMGRGGAIFAWHPTEDVLFFFDDNKLQQLDFRANAKARSAHLVPDWGQVNGDYLAFSQDGKSVLVGIMAANQAADDHQIQDLGLIPLDGSAARRFALPKGMRSGQVIRSDAYALWQSIANTATLETFDADTSGSIIRRLDLTTGEWTTVHSDPQRITFASMPRNQSFLVATVDSYRSPADAYRFDTDFASRHPLTCVEPRMAGVEVGRREYFRTVVPLHDGQLKSVRTSVLIPQGAKMGNRLPAIICTYGGANLAGAIASFDTLHVATIPAAIFTTRGYAVLWVDAPLGPEGQPGQPAEELRDVVLPQVYRAGELGYIDINRVAVAGQSYGAYCAASLITSTNLFRAAIAVSGRYDLVSDYGFGLNDKHFGSNSVEKGPGRMGQPPWSDLRRYLDNSPYYRADRIHTPLLIIHGRDDFLPVQGAERMFYGLRRLGLTAQLAIYDGEGHVIREWDPQNAIDATQRILNFLERHLRKT